MKVTINYQELVREQSSGLWMDLFTAAFKDMEAYQSDLMHDAAILANAPHNAIFIWGWRKTGTCLWRVNTETEQAATFDTLRVSPNPIFNHRIIEIRRPKGQWSSHPTGFITNPKAQSTEELITTIRDYVEMFGKEFREAA